MVRSYPAKVVGVRTYTSFDAHVHLGFGITLSRRVHLAGIDENTFGTGPEIRKVAFGVLIAILGGQTVLIRVEEGQMQEHITASVEVSAVRQQVLDAVELARAAMLQKDVEPREYVRAVLGSKV